MKRILLFVVFCALEFSVAKTINRPKIKGRSELASQEAARSGDELFKQAFDKKKKEKAVKALVDRAAAYLANHDLADACLKFTRKKEFISGDTYIFVFDMQGRLLAHGEQPELLFSNMLNEKDAFGFLYVQDMLEKARKQGDGWVTYSWRNAIKMSYIKLVKKKNESFIVGAGYYPHNKEDHVVSMVKGGVTLFNKLLVEGYPVTEAFSTMNYPLKSGFAVGDLYLYALDFKGNVYAHADRPGRAGTNVLNEQYEGGRFVNQEIIKLLQEKNEPIWIEYISRNTTKRTYVEKVVDREGNNYFIACGYYPEADRKAAEDLVGRAVQFLESNGKSQGAMIISSRKDDTLRYGDLYVVLYDMKGKIVAHGWNSELEGQDYFMEKDQDGRFYVQEIIEQAKTGGGWVNHKVHGSFQSTYVELIDLSVEKLVVTCAFYPISKRETIMMLVSSAITAFKVGNFHDTLRLLTQVTTGSFIRGDLKVFVIDMDGICYAWGDNYRLIWKDLSSWKDQDGQLFIRNMIEATLKGPSHIGYRFNDQQAVSYVERFERNGKSYIIGSSFYF
jgi:cytochrome c